MVNVTTDKCYRNQDWVWGYRESDPLGGRDPYSNSKACAELVAQAYRHSFFPAEDVARHRVAIGCARAGNVIGGGDWTPHQLVPAVVAAFERGEAVELRHPEAVRPWQHVLDCLRGYLTLAEVLATEPERSIGDWNFGPASDDVVTVAQVAETLAPYWRVSPAWRQLPGERTKEERELRLDCSKANRQLGWRGRLSTRIGLEWVAQWYLRTRSGVAPRECCEAQIDAYLALSGP
jgi:CDP-glucose 4,6-dehydratase